MASNGARFTAEGEKALSRTTIFGFGKSQKFQDAADAFQKAGNAYKLSAEYTFAGQSFLRAADNFQKADAGNSDVLTAIVEAGNCFKLGNDLQKAVDAFSQAIMAYEETQRFGQCARYQKEVAEIYEGNGDIEGAIACYQKVSTDDSNGIKTQSSK
jgi:alpha-soluble NSF attachment protein